MTTEQYQKIIADVEKEFSQFLAKAESDSATPLAKSEDASEDKSDEKKDEKKEEEKEESKPEEKKEEEKEEPKAEEKKEEEEKSGDEQHNYDDQDIEEMHKMYHSMPKSELELHKAAAEKCLMAKCGEMTSVAKSEKDTIVVVPTVTSEDTSLIKSQIDNLSKENDDLKKNVESLVQAMAKFINTKKAPARKAITELGFLNKSEEEKTEEKPMSKSEITTILSRKAQEPTLSKSDREAIDKYYLGNGGSETIRHLLK